MAFHCRPARIGLALVALLALACGGSGGGSPSEPRPPGLALTVTATPSAIGPQGTAQIVVQASDPSGGSVAGLPIALATTLGALDSAALTTDAAGRAATVLRGTGAAGTARVTARVEGRAVTAAADVRIGLDAVVGVSVVPGTIAGSQAATVTALVFAAGGAPPPAGTVVDFATSLGELSPASAATDALGVARTTLRTGGDVGTAAITARALGLTDTTQAVLRPAWELRVEAGAAGIPSGGQTPVTVRLVALDPAAAVGNRELRLQTTRGRLAETRLRTNGLGVATTTLFGDGDSGPAVLTATMPGAAPGTATVFLGGGGPTVSLTANPTAVPSGGATTLTVVVAAADGSPLSGITVELATSRGRLDATRLQTGPGGLASTALRSDGTSGQAVVTATIAGTATTDQVVVTFG